MDVLYNINFALLQGIKFRRRTSNPTFWLALARTYMTL